MQVLELVAVVALACWLLSAGLRWLIEGQPPRAVRTLSTWRDRRRSVRNARTCADTVILELELARIAERLQAEYFTVQPARAERVRSWTLAYDRVLIELCESCTMPAPRAVPPLSTAERFSLEHALVGAGRSW